MRCAARDAIQCAARGLVAFARCAGWLQLHAQIQAQRAGCSCMRRYRRHAFDGGIFRVGFFWDRFNTHQCSYVTRADRRVKGWLRRDGWMGGQRNGCMGGRCVRYGRIGGLKDEYKGGV